ncbi:MAG: nucleotide pyrophosphohydrolase [Desulfuromonadales bacterium]|nr:nucleotide pyrophosphohydrolase [Desulfuromonadales bacterium]
MPEIDDLKQKIREFADDRNWDQYHSPKNLSMALIAECAEVVEHFQWMTEEQSTNVPAETLEEISLELADVFVYLLRLSDKLGIDLVEAANRKMALNEKKYPVDKVRGSSKKYTEYID